MMSSTSLSLGIYDVLLRVHAPHNLVLNCLLARMFGLLFCYPEGLNTMVANEGVIILQNEMEY